MLIKTKFMKRSYHTDLMIQYKLGMLDNSILKKIPSSTLHNWKNRDVHQIFGLESSQDFEKNKELIRTFMTSQKMQNVAKSMYTVYKTYNRIFDKLTDKSKIFRDFREDIIETIEKVRDPLGFEDALKAFDISYNQFYAWKRRIKCRMHEKMFCRKLNPKQLTDREVKTISEYLQNPIYQHWNLSSIYYKILRDKSAYFCKTTFYKYAKKLNIERKAKFKKLIKVGLRASSPKKTLHMDVTIYRAIDNTRIYIYLLVDNYSRYILNWKASSEYSAKISYENISEAYEKYNLNEISPHVDIVTDGGSENKGKFESYVKHDKDNLKKVIAQSDIQFSNSMVEAVNRKLKYDYLFTRQLFSIEDTQYFLKFAINDYNHKPIDVLHGLTPHEVFNGLIPNKDMFKLEIKNALTQRQKINLQENCLSCF